MCGITGFISAKINDQQRTGERMAACMKHRGPDAQRVWFEDQICLAHARLSILDLSDAGLQPMLSKDQRYSMVYNGEVYNHLALRDELAHTEYRGHSDTETILEAFCQWGIEKTINKLNGMFAIALFDRQERRLTLIRDRIGIKPLYYGWCGDSFVFASELKPIRAFDHFNNSISAASTELFLRYNYIPCPHSIFEDIYKLPQGCMLHIDVPTKPADFSPHANTTQTSPKSYWSLASIKAQPFTGSIDQAQEQLDTLLTDAVKSRMISDVPLGAFLSGGIDSSLTVALMQKSSPTPVKTFTIGNSDKFYDEATHAKEVAKHLGTDHTELYITPADALAVVPKLTEIYDEPFADSSQIPTWLVSKLARESVTVALSGDGGDELFAGYRRHFQAAPFWQKASRLPMPLRKLLANSARFGVDCGFIDLLKRYAPFLLPASFKSGSVTDSVYKAADVLDSATINEYYQRLISQNQHPQKLLLNPAATSENFNLPGNFSSEIRAMMYMDLMMYHPDDILVKVDRASMANSLEARVPLVDYRVVEFAQSLPLEFMIKENGGKYLLKRLLKNYVPQNLVDRPKMGFSIPLADWLRTELRDWCEDLLSVESLNNNNLLNGGAVRQMWLSHQSGQRDYKYQLWAVLMLQNWIKNLPRVPDNNNIV